jgi:hypothetical protein
LVSKSKDVRCSMLPGLSGISEMIVREKDLVSQLGEDAVDAHVALGHHGVEHPSHPCVGGERRLVRD